MIDLFNMVSFHNYITVYQGVVGDRNINGISKSLFFPRIAEKMSHHLFHRNHI